jgi:hypothetical protein
MIERIKYNVFVFFARIRTKKLIKKLEQNLQDYSWYIGVEKNDNPELIRKYEEARTQQFIAKTTLKGLQYH